ncbi:hypothetical protein JHK82_018957 [Glycine max]|nr:hypothetical protein JHK85_019396 [Glycine max]KAG5143262.1 hypothetical protein JHK82_018957 [Glycine max]
MTGRAVNPLFRGAYLSEFAKQKVTLLVPWLCKSDQELVCPNNLTFTSPEEQEAYMRSWLEERIGFKADFKISFYPGKFSEARRSIIPAGDTSQFIPSRDADIAILKEPEHLNWYHHGKRWTNKFNHVVGIVHTNYIEYIKREKNGALQVFLVKHINNWVTRAYCHKVFRLLDATLGIRITVSNLLDHHSARVQDRAKTLFDGWKGVGNGDTESHEVEFAKVDNASDKIVSKESQPSTLNEDGNDNDPASGLIGCEKSLLRSSNDLLVHSSDNVPQLSTTVECIDIKEGSANHVASVPSSAQEVAPTHEGLPICTTGEATSAGTCKFFVTNQSSFEGQSDVVQLSNLAKMEKQEQNVNDPSEKLGAPEIYFVSSNKPEPQPISMVACEAKAPESMKEPALEKNVEHNEDGVCHKLTTSASMRTPASDRSGEDDATSITQVFKATENDNDCCSNALQGTSVSDSNLGKTEVLDMSVSGTEYVIASKENKGHEEDTSSGPVSISTLSNGGIDEFGGSAPWRRDQPWCSNSAYSSEKEKVEGEELHKWLRLVVAPTELAIFIDGKQWSLLPLQTGS